MGRPRQKVRVEGNVLTFSGNGAGLLAMTASLLDRAVDPMRDSLELAELREYDPPGGWYGNFEPGSPSLDLKRDGPAVDPSGGFSFEASSLSIHEGRIKSGRPTNIKVLVSGPSEAPLLVRLTMKAENLVALAKDLAALSQSPDGFRLGCLVEWGPKREEGFLRLEKKSFPTNVPWAELRPIAGKSRKDDPSTGSNP